MRNSRGGLRDIPLISFARTRSERDTAGDPRPSLEERYGSRENYIARVETAAAALVADRLLRRLTLMPMSTPRGNAIGSDYLELTSA